MAAPQKKVAVKKTASKKKVSGEFKSKSGSSPKKVKAFKKPDLIVKQKSVSKKLLGAGLGLFASGAIAGTLAASLLKKKSVGANTGSGGSGTDPVSIHIQEIIRSRNDAIEEAESKSENLKIINAANNEAIKAKDIEIAAQKAELSLLKYERSKYTEQITELKNNIATLKAQYEGLRFSRQQPLQ